jgi:hypothetical protein
VFCGIQSVYKSASKFVKVDLVLVDEAHIDLELPKFPLYLVLGKRDQPFGLFENYLIAEPLTMDAYETKAVGLTFGYRGPLGLDLACSLYKGQVLMTQLFQAEVFDTQIVQLVPQHINRVNSVVLSASASPSAKYLYLYGAYLSEPGNDRRNRTINLGFDFTAPFLENLKLDAEYMKALDRETYQGQNRSFKEGAFSMTVVYLFVLGERKHRGSGNYRGRKAQITAYPFEIAARYEFFDDDSMSDILGVRSAKNRVSLGGRYMQRWWQPPCAR